MTLRRTIWRWHFYAGLFVLPFIMVLALSGTVFLFKPQIDRWEERAFLDLPAAGTVAPSVQVEAALAAFPGARLHSYRLPERAGDSALVHVAMPHPDEPPDGQPATMRDVFVSPQGKVLGSVETDARIVEVARRIHGQLLLGERGSWLVELAACWAIVMIITGFYLWWPRGRGAAGVLWPRRNMLLHDLHATTGFWVAAFALVLLLTGLPWTDVWGNAFGMVRAEFGWVQGAPQWSTEGGDPSRAAAGEAHDHDHALMTAPAAEQSRFARLDDVVGRATHEPLAFPTFVLAPGAALFGAASQDWVASSLTQDRPLGMSITYDAASGMEVARERFADRHPIDRVIGYGLAWHEGALFGAVNQAIGVLTALALVLLAVTGFLQWRRRKPAGLLGAPARLPNAKAPPLRVAVITLALAALLPMLALSLVALWLFDLALARVSPKVAVWLGIASPTRPSEVHS